MHTSKDKKSSTAGAKSSDKKTDAKKSDTKETAVKSDSKSSFDTKKTTDKNTKK
jgi:hypothetical protein